MATLSDIRPTARPIAPLTPAAPRSAAQKAFFDQALGRATGGAAPVQAAPGQAAAVRPETPTVRTHPPAPAERSPTVQTASLQTALRNIAAFTPAPAPAPDSPAEAPRRILRPGSLVDIKV